jgi:hypothetical protein
LRVENGTESIADIAVRSKPLHTSIRTRIANAFRDKKLYEVYEEVSCVADGGSTRRIDIIAIANSSRHAYILDPTVRFERSSSQPLDVNKEKKAVYEPTINYFISKFKLKQVEVIGLMVGARGTIPGFFNEFRKRFGFSKEFLKDVVLLALRRSVSILKNHQYG